MNILNKFTFRSLKLNKKRTFVTLIGIILSVALITAVAGMFASFQETMVRAEIKIGGKFHTVFREAPQEALDVIRNHRGIESYFYIQPLGHAHFDNRFEHTPYLFVAAFNENALENTGIRLIEGRLPQNENEIIITNRVLRESVTNYQIGDKLSLEIFNLERNINVDEDGNIVDWNEEEEYLFTREYTIVGIADNILNHLVDWFGEESHTVITYLNKPTDDINLFVYYHNPQNTDEISALIAQQFGIERYITNRNLLRWQGVVGDNTLSILYGIASVVISVIIFTSIFVIRNGFSISVLERTKEYGILASIGTTKKQIRKSVLFEGLILGLIAIPLGIISGLIAVYILIWIVNTLMMDAFTLINMVYIIPYLAIGVSIILGALTIYLSCIFIAFKTSRISPIMNIRNNNDIKIKAKKLKNPRFIEKIFGLGGTLAYKNMKRNKKRYTTTVISMIVSVVIFITMSSFINYTFRETLHRYDITEYNIAITSSEREGLSDFIPQILALLEENEDYWIINSTAMIINNRYVDLEHDLVDEESEQMILVYSIGDRAFRNFVNSLGLNYQTVRNQGIFIKATNADHHFYKITNNVELRSLDGESFNLPISTITTETPINVSGMGYIIVSDEMLMRNVVGEIFPHMLINANDPDTLETEILELSQSLFVTNFEASRIATARIVLMISIFLYGFISVIIIIGLTNIINTLTTSLNLRKKELAMLKAIGVTNKEFKQMINLESIFLGIKVLLISIPIGMFFSYLIYNFISNAEGGIVTYDPNLFAIIISIIAVFLIVKMIMSFTLRQINKQNIIEVIRNDNI